MQPRAYRAPVVVRASLSLVTALVILHTTSTSEAQPISVPGGLFGIPEVTWHTWTSDPLDPAATFPEWGWPVFTLTNETCKGGLTGCSQDNGAQCVLYTGGSSPQNHCQFPGHPVDTSTHCGTDEDCWDRVGACVDHDDDFGTPPVCLRYGLDVGSCVTTADCSGNAVCLDGTCYSGWVTEQTPRRCTRPWRRGLPNTPGAIECLDEAWVCLGSDGAADSGTCYLPGRQGSVELYYEEHVSRLISPGAIEHLGMFGTVPDSGLPEWDPGTEALAQVTLMNPNPFDVHLLSCGMTNLNPGLVPNIDTPKRGIVLQPRQSRAECIDGVDETSHPPSYHFGCEAFTLAAGTPSSPSRTRTVLTAGFNFVDAGGDPIDWGPGDVQTFYVDHLQWSDVRPSCDDLPGPNTFLSPADTGGNFNRDHTATINLWATGTPITADLSTQSVVKWPAGNWDTMAPDADDAAVYLTGTVTGLPASALVRLQVPDGNGAAIVEHEVLEADGGDPCVGDPVQLALEYVIPNPAPIFSSLTVDLSNTDCEQFLESDRGIKLDASVFAGEPYLHYATGERMYDVHALLFHDTGLPEVADVFVTFNNEGILSGDFYGVDSYTTPTQAWVYVEQPGQDPLAILAEIDVTQPDNGTRTHFIVPPTELDPSEPIVVTLFVYDEGYNVGMTEPLELDPDSELKFDAPLMVASEQPTPGAGQDADCTCTIAIAQRGIPGRRGLWAIVSLLTLLSLRQRRVRRS